MGCAMKPDFFDEITSHLERGEFKLDGHDDIRLSCMGFDCKNCVLDDDIACTRVRESYLKYIIENKLNPWAFL